MFRPCAIVRRCTHRGLNHGYSIPCYPERIGTSSLRASPPMSAYTKSANSTLGLSRRVSRSKQGNGMNLCSRNSSRVSKRPGTTIGAKKNAHPSGSRSRSSSATFGQSQVRSSTMKNCGTGRFTVFQGEKLPQDIRQAAIEILGKSRTLPIPRWISHNSHTTTLSECFGHSSFILVAVSYAMDDFLQLRIIAVAGSAAMLVFTYFHPHGRVLWLPFKWNVLFIVLNSYRIGRVYWEQYRATNLSDELLHIRDRHFYAMDPVDFSKLTRLGKVDVHTKGDILVEQDEGNRYIRLVLSGCLSVRRDGTTTYCLTEGNFIAETGLHAGLMIPGQVDSCCAIVADSDVRVLTWDRTELIDLMNLSVGIRRSLKAVLSWDIVRKLKYQRQMLSSGVVYDAAEWTRLRHEQSKHRYTAIVKQILASDQPQTITKRMNPQLEKYRMIHHIDDDYHEAALKECGWTVGEFKEHLKKGEESNTNWTDLSASIPATLRWCHREFWIRLFL